MQYKCLVHYLFDMSVHFLAHCQALTIHVDLIAPTLLHACNMLHLPEDKLSTNLQWVTSAETDIICLPASFYLSSFSSLFILLFATLLCHHLLFLPHLQVLAKVEEANQVGRKLPPDGFYNQLIR